MATEELKALNAVIKNKDIAAVFKGNTGDLFEAYQDVWTYLKEYYSRYRAIPDIEIVKERFSDFEDVEVKGATDYHLDRLRNEFISNRIESLVLKAGSKIGPETAEIVLNGLQRDLSKLSRLSAVSSDTDIMDFDLAEEHYLEVRERAAAMGGVPGIPTGIASIDSSIPMGLQGGDVVSIIGYPARGKSALISLLAGNMYSKGYKVMIVSLEMPASAVRDRVYTIMGTGLFKNSELAVGQVSIDNLRSFANKKSTDGSIIVIEGSGAPVTPHTIQAKIDEYKPDVVIIDYMQLMMDNNKSEDMTRRMMNLSLEIKQETAVGNDIPVFAISSATPPSGQKIDGPPSVEQTAWSRQLSYDSSLCIAVHKFDDTDIFQLSCAKNRYGPLFECYLEWKINDGILKEVYDIA